jgi:hypothetical protein
VTDSAFEALRAPNPQFTPHDLRKYAEGFNKWSLRGPEHEVLRDSTKLVCWAREQSIEETDIISSVGHQAIPT